MNIIKNDLYDYENRYIYQHENYFKFSLDSILLAEYIELKKNAVLMDLCTGFAPVPLIVSTVYENKIYGVEIQEDVSNSAKMSVELNGLSDQITIINDDILNLEKHFAKNSIDVISCNPPFFKFSECSIVNESEFTKISRHEVLIKLEEIFRESSMFLKHNGSLYMVHRPERIDEIIILANKYNMNVKELVTIVTDAKGTTKTILVKCMKNSKQGVRVRTLNVNNRNTYKGIFKE